MEERARDLIKRGNQLFDKRAGLMNFWQEIADHFYPERAAFTRDPYLGEEFASQLSTSYPLLIRRDLGNAFPAMLRPTQKEWVAIHAARDDREDQPSRAWMEDKTKVMRRAMYDPEARFNRATKEGDHDYAAFGNAVISVELNRAQDALLYRNWHLRDVAWCEGAEGAVDTVHRKWKPTAYDLAGTFAGDKLHQNVKDQLQPGRDPYSEFECRHVVVPWDQYEGPYKAQRKNNPTPFVSVYIDVANEHVIEETPSWDLIYVIARWQTVSGSQYANSPATVCALPEARLLQAMVYTLLEAGEKAVDPPMIATQEAVRSEIDIRAGGITWVDYSYDEKLGAALRNLDQDTSGIPLGIDMQRDARALLSKCFFLDSISMPPPGKDMTAYEVAKRVEEYIRNALPLFEPMEVDYNGQLCERTFGRLLRAGAFGAPQDIPESIRGQDVQFRFESPLRDAEGRQKMARMVETRNALATVAEIDQLNNPNVDSQEMLRDVLKGIPTPAKWLRDERAVAAEQADRAKRAQGQALMAAAGQMAAVAEPAAKASKALAEAEAVQAAA